MSTELHLPAVASGDSADWLGPAQKTEALQRGVAKIVALGARAGISPEQMIELLQGGLTVLELLEYLGSRSAVEA
jgi:hypothetical protein